MNDGRMEEVQRPHDVPRVNIPDVSEPSEPLSESSEPMGDTAGAPFSEIPNEHLGASGEAALVRTKAKVDAVKMNLRGPEVNAPQALTLQRDALNMQLRDLRVNLRNSDTFFARFTQAGREKIASLNKAINETVVQRNEIEATMEGMLPKMAPSGVARDTSRGAIVSEARQKIGDVLASALAGKQDRRANIPRKDALRADRIKLNEELTALRFWQFGRKQEIAAKIREIDQEMSGIIKAEREQ